MRVLTINYGSSSPRFRLSETRPGPADEERRLAWETGEGVGSRGTLDWHGAHTWRRLGPGSQGHCLLAGVARCAQDLRLGPVIPPQSPRETPPSKARMWRGEVVF